jgi:hypothetical protein
MTDFDRLRQDGWGDGIITIASSLDADGYDLQIDRLDDDRIRGEVSARPDACADCLVPKGVMATIIATACGIDASAVELVYPEDATAAH